MAAFCCLSGSWLPARGCALNHSPHLFPQRSLFCFTDVGVGRIGIDDAGRLNTASRTMPRCGWMDCRCLGGGEVASFSMTAGRNRGCRAKLPGPQKKNQRVSRPDVERLASRLHAKVLFSGNRPNRSRKKRFLAGIDGHTQTSRGSMGTVEPATAFFIRLMSTVPEPKAAVE